MLVRAPASVTGSMGVSAFDRSQSVGSRATVPERMGMYRGTTAADCPSSGVLCRLVDSGKAEFLSLKAAFDKVVSADTNTVTGRKFVDQKTDVARTSWMVSAVAMSDFNPSVMTIDVGGWDTHNRQGMNLVDGSYYKNLAALGEALGNLRADLKKQSNGAGGTVWDDTVVVVMSEFGRTAVSNGSFGTDHGRGSAMLVMGGKVNKNHKDATEKFNLSTLAGTGSSRALMVHVDYRDVMAEIIHRHLGVNLTDVFEDYTPATSKFLNVIKT